MPTASGRGRESAMRAPLATMGDRIRSHHIEVPMKKSAPLRVTAIVAAAALCGITALTGCSAVRGNTAADAADPAASSTPTADPPGAGSDPVVFLVSNWTGYTFTQGEVTGSVSASASQVGPDSAVTVDLANGTTSSGEIYYDVYDTDGTTFLGTIVLNFKKDLSTGLSIADKPLGDFGQNFNIFGVDTSGSTAVFFTDGVCEGSFEKGGSSIDQTMVNATPYPMTLISSASPWSGWYQQPPATLAPGGCAEINSYSDFPVEGYGFNAVYSFETPSGTQYAVFANDWCPPASTTCGLTRSNRVFSTKPQMTGGGWLGTISTTYFTYDSNVTTKDDHVHLDSVVGPSPE